MKKRRGENHMSTEWSGNEAWFESISPLSIVNISHLQNNCVVYCIFFSLFWLTDEKYARLNLKSFIY